MRSAWHGNTWQDPLGPEHDCSALDAQPDCLEHLGLAFVHVFEESSTILIPDMFSINKVFVPHAFQYPVFINAMRL